MINNKLIDNLIDRSIVAMCLFGIWADVHEVDIVARAFYYISGFYGAVAIIVIIVKAYYKFKINRTYDKS
jgi:hypothetical protein